MQIFYKRLLLCYWNLLQNLCSASFARHQTTLLLLFRLKTWFQQGDHTFILNREELGLKSSQLTNDSEQRWRKRRFKIAASDWDISRSTLISIFSLGNNLFLSVIWCPPSGWELYLKLLGSAYTMCWETETLWYVYRHCWERSPEGIGKSSWIRWVWHCLLQK